MIRSEVCFQLVLKFSKNFSEKNRDIELVQTRVNVLVPRGISNLRKPLLLPVIRRRDQKNDPQKRITHVKNHCKKKESAPKNRMHHSIRASGVRRLSLAGGGGRARQRPPAVVVGMDAVSRVLQSLLLMPGCCQTTPADPVVRAASWQVHQTYPRILRPTSLLFFTQL